MNDGMLKKVVMDYKVLIILPVYFFVASFIYLVVTLDVNGWILLEVIALILLLMILFGIIGDYKRLKNLSDQGWMRNKLNWFRIETEWFYLGGGDF